MKRPEYPEHISLSLMSQQDWNEARIDHAKAMESYADEMDRYVEWLLEGEAEAKRQLGWVKAKVLPVLRECEEELNSYYEHEHRGDHPVSVRKREANIASNPATALIKELEGEDA